MPLFIHCDTLPEPDDLKAQAIIAARAHGWKSGEVIFRSGSVGDVEQVSATVTEEEVGRHQAILMGEALGSQKTWVKTIDLRLRKDKGGFVLEQRWMLVGWWSVSPEVEEWRPVPIVEDATDE